MYKRFEIISTGLEGLVVLQRKPRRDERGYLERMLCVNDLASLLNGKSIQQINHTLTTKKGTIRGLHLQRSPHAEVKFVSCLRGEVFDVAVDLRPSSPTFGRWHGQLLSSDNMQTLMIPEGFAHGFQTLSGDCEMLYFHTTNHAPSSEAGVHPQDSTLAIAWPLPPLEMSERDSRLPTLKEFSP